ncbi:MAG TPA: transcription-repair coupling factor [Deltaproteobacteria bacterium]|nr:transcription-repair coupling factor [Deltaproteobacteria bacterium]
MDSIQTQLSRVRSIGALPLSLQALVVACVFRQGQKSVLWIAENTEEMYQIQENLSVFLDEDLIRIYQNLDVRPYQDDSPSREVSARRISLLFSLLSGSPGVFVAPFDSLLLPVMPPGDLVGSAIHLAVDRDVDRDALAERLVRMGYTREALIDDIGQFSIRGSVVDIFSPGMDEPVRIDLFGDTITSIKTFRLATQRSGGQLGSVTILPAGEILLDMSHVRNARPWLRRMKGSSMGELITDIEQGISPPGIESYLPLFYEKPATVFDYLPSGTLIAGPDPFTLDTWYEKTYAVFAHAYEKLGDRKGGYLPPESFLAAKEDVTGAAGGTEVRISTSLDGEGASVPFSTISLMAQAGRASEALIETATSLKDQGMDVFVFAGSDMLMERLAYALTNRGLAPAEAHGSSLFSRSGWGSKVFLAPGSLSSGFVLPSLGVAVLSADEAMGARKRRRKGAAGGAPLLNPFTQLNVGDAVVHQENGIGIFKGVVRLELDGFKSDFVLLEYLGGDKLYVPVYKLSLLQRYIGDTDVFIIDRLGGTRWTRATAKARESVAKLANELLAIYAKRESSSGFSYDTSAAVMEEFEETFPYEETDDQLKAVEDVYADMASARPMDRLVCGDVGYGKTEVALRAAYAAVMSGRQVAVLVPTTLLARQHLNTFRQRLSSWPIRVEAISGFSTSAQNAQIIGDLEKGRVDIVIGTHALLSERVKFRDLGLLIVDEEHRFGVKDKEKIKSKRAEVDILTLTATPIPRTLNMAISGIRDLSIIETPPVDRKSIETTVSRFDEEEVQQAITRELMRGGQVFFVHNQVSTIDTMARRISELVPLARVGVAHGQMSRPQLEKIMSKFLDRSVNVLVTSAIISSGIDIPSANTIIINRADKFGLADLYQLRGRVGRSKTRGNALLLTPAAGQITKDARKRLAAIKEYESLGAGFQMALRDMEIRGVGDILGRAQWGHVTAIGYELYQQMLKEAVDKLQGKEVVQEIDPEIHIHLDAYIPEEYCPDQHLRLGLYKRLFSADASVLPEILSEISDLYGDPPKAVRELITIAEIRDRLKKMRIKKLERENNHLRLYLGRDSMVDLGVLIDMVTVRQGRLYPQGVVEIPIGAEDVSNEVRDILYRIA